MSRYLIPEIPYYRSPLGAVADGTACHFKITLPRDHAVLCRPTLLVQHAGITALSALICSGAA